VRLSSGRVLVGVLIVVSVATAVVLSRATRFTPSDVGPTDTLTPSATPFSPHVQISPLPSGGGPVLSSPQSAPAGAGVVYAVRLLALCAALVDFDGSFWSSPPGFTLLKPTQPATVTLTRSGSVLLRTAGGQEVALVRIQGPVTVPACPRRH